MFDFLNRNRAKRARRTQKELLTEDLDLEIRERMNVLQGLNIEITKAALKKASLYEKTFDNMVELREAGYEDYMPVKQPKFKGDIVSVISGFIDDESLGIPKLARGAVKAYLEKNKDKLNEKLEGFIEKNADKLLENIEVPKGRQAADQ